MAVLRGPIVAIGGGEMDTLKTLSIDRYIVGLTGKNHPKALFIPTASGDAKGYISSFKKVYGMLLGCRVDVLSLIAETPQEDEMRSKILAADLVYVGGGNSTLLMSRWSETGMAQYLADAHFSGTVLSGMSAGGNCWFDYGHTMVGNDKEQEWKYIRGLGLIKGAFCPHFNQPMRRKSYGRVLARLGVAGYALEDHSAIDIRNGESAILKSDPRSKAFRLYGDGEKVETIELFPSSI